MVIDIMGAKVSKKVSEIMSELGWIGKDQSVTMQGKKAYDYVSETQFISEIRPKMIERGLVFYPEDMRIISMERVERNYDKKSSISFLTTICVTYVIEDSESGETIKVSTIGQGADATDKGAPKAMTSALKYALRQLFLIPTGDDPEATNEKGSQVSKPKSNNYSDAKERGGKETKESTPTVSRQIQKGREHLIKVFEKANVDLDSYSKLWNEYDIDVSGQDVLPDDLDTLRAMYNFGQSIANDGDVSAAEEKFRKDMEE